MSQTAIKSVYDTAKRSALVLDDFEAAREAIVEFLMLQQRTHNNILRGNMRRKLEIVWTPEVNNLVIFAVTEVAPRLRDIDLIRTVVRIYRNVYTGVRADQVCNGSVQMFKHVAENLDTAAAVLEEAGLLADTPIDANSVVNQVADIAFEQRSDAAVRTTARTAEIEEAVDNVRFWWEAAVTVIDNIRFNTRATQGAYIHCCNGVLRFCREYNRVADLGCFYDRIARHVQSARAYLRKSATEPSEFLPQHVVAAQINLRIDILAAAVDIGAWQTGLAAVEGICEILQDDPNALSASPHYLCALEHVASLFRNSGHLLYNGLSLLALFRGQRAAGLGALASRVHEDTPWDISETTTATAAVTGAVTPAEGAEGAGAFGEAELDFVAASALALANVGNAHVDTAAVHSYAPGDLRATANAVLMAAIGVPIAASTSATGSAAGTSSTAARASLVAVDEFLTRCGLERAMLTREGLVAAVKADRVLRAFADPAVTTLFDLLEAEPVFDPTPADEIITATVDDIDAASGIDSDTKTVYMPRVRAAALTRAIMALAASKTASEISLDELESLVASLLPVSATASAAARRTALLTHLVSAARARVVCARINLSAGTVSLTAPAYPTSSHVSSAALAAPAAIRRLAASFARPLLADDDEDVADWEDAAAEACTTSTARFQGAIGRLQQRAENARQAKIEAEEAEREARVRRAREVEEALRRENAEREAERQRAEEIAQRRSALKEMVRKLAKSSVRAAEAVEERIELLAQDEDYVESANELFRQVLTTHLMKNNERFLRARRDLDIRVRLLRARHIENAPDPVQRAAKFNLFLDKTFERSHARAVKAHEDAVADLPRLERLLPHVQTFVDKYVNPVITAEREAVRAKEQAIIDARRAEEKAKREAEEAERRKAEKERAEQMRRERAEKAAQEAEEKAAMAEEKERKQSWRGAAKNVTDATPSKRAPALSRGDRPTGFGAGPRSGPAAAGGAKRPTSFGGSGDRPTSFGAGPRSGAASSAGAKRPTGFGQKRTMAFGQK